MAARARCTPSEEFATSTDLTGRSRTGPPLKESVRGSDRLYPRENGTGVLGSSCCDVRETKARIVQQQQMDALPFELVIVIQAASINECYVAFAVLGDDLLDAFLYLVREL